MDKFIELSANLIQMFIWTWFMTAFFGFKRSGFASKVGFLLMWMAAFLEISYINHIIDYDGFLTGIITITFIIYAQCYLKGNLGTHIFIALYSTAIIFILASVTIFIFSYITGFSTKSHIADFSIRRIVIVYLCRVLEFLVFKFIVRINANYKLTKKEWIPFIALPLATWGGVTFMTQATIESESVLPQMFYIAIIMVGMNIIIGFFMYKIKQDESLRLEYELSKLEQENKEKMTSDLIAWSDNLDSVKHDMEKHFLAIQSLAEDRDYRQIIDYSQKIIREKLNSVGHSVLTENVVFNAVINTKLAICENKEISVNVNIDNDAVKYINNSDIAVLFGNIFENAIEASENSDMPRISLNVQQQDEYISIYMENSFSSEYSDINLSTTKKDKKHHGIGTKNVKRLVKEYDGMIQYFVNDMGMFCCDILLKKHN